MINSNRSFIYSLTCIAIVLTVVMLYGDRFASVAGDNNTGAGERRSLKLAAEYKKNSLEDISADGRLLLFYQTSVPIRSFTIPLDGSRGKANQPEVYDDMLRVVERESGREVGHIKVESFPRHMQFIPGTQQVFYREPNSSENKDLFKVWDLSNGDVRVCSDQTGVDFRYPIFVDAQNGFGALLQENSGEVLSKLTLPDCTQTTISLVYPENPQGRTSGGLNLSRDKRYLAYGTGDSTIGIVIVRDTATLSIIKRIKPPSGLIFGDSSIYTPDGKFLLIVASNTYFDKTETRRYLLFYDTTNYEMKRQFDITSWRPPDVRDPDYPPASNSIGTTMAISPDSRLLAVGYTKEEKKFLSIIEQAHVVLYDLTTGEEVARASHPAVQQKRSDPFIAMINKLAFTPDGKYLLSSTYDTRVWQIGN